jgi:hypothetical protein
VKKVSLVEWAFAAAAVAADVVWWNAGLDPAREDRRMPEMVKRKSYENRQADYTDQFTVTYWREEDQTYFAVAERRPPDPYGAYEKSHVDAQTGKLCFAKGREPRSLEQCEAYVHAWMLKYSVYIRTGASPKGSVRINL